MIRDRMKAVDVHTIDYASLWHAVSKRFPLPARSIHGPDHWQRVETIGLRLAPETGADPIVVRLFALFHDSQRWCEDTDPEHGLRGAVLAEEFRGLRYEIEDEAFEQLRFACVHHADGEISLDSTIGTCWDADRLDLGRVGITLRAEYLSTKAARRPDFLRWADSLRDG